MSSRVLYCRILSIVAVILGLFFILSSLGLFGWEGIVAYLSFACFGEVIVLSSLSSISYNLLRQCPYCKVRGHVFEESREGEPVKLEQGWFKPYYVERETWKVCDYCTHIYDYEENIVKYDPTDGE